MDDDFFLSNADAVVDPDAKMPAHKRKRMVEAARAYLATQPKKKGLRDGIKKGKVSKSDDEDEDAEAEGNMNQTVDDMDLVGSAAESDSDSESDKETAAQKRLRLARRYLAKVEEEVQDAADADADDIDAAQIDKDLIAERLKDDVLEAAGKLFRPIAAQYDALDGNALEIRTFKGGKKGHQLSVTAIALCMPSDAQDGTNLAGSTGSTPPIHLFSASKDAGLIKWDFYTGQRTGERPGSLKPTKKLLKAVSQKKLKEHKGHHDHILSVACSQDGKFLVCLLRFFSLPKSTEECSLFFS